MQLNPDDMRFVQLAFLQAIDQKKHPLAEAVRLFLDAFPSAELKREAF
jgi:hypothetical protein